MIHVIERPPIFLNLSFEVVGIITVVFTLLYRAVLQSSLDNWVLGYELADNVAKY